MRIRTTQIPATEIDIGRIKVSSGRKITIVPLLHTVKDPHQSAAKTFAIIFGNAEQDTPIREVRQTTRGYIFETEE